MAQMSSSKAPTVGTVAAPFPVQAVLGLLAGRVCVRGMSQRVRCRGRGLRVSRSERQGERTNPQSIQVDWKSDVHLIIIVW